MIALEWKRAPRTFLGLDGIAGAGLAVAGAALAWPYATALHRFAPPCTFLHLTGLPCGTCGFTRAFVRGAHLEIAAAFQVSPFAATLFYVWAPLSLWIAAGWIFPSLRRFPALRPTGRGGAFALRFGIPLAFVANWIYLLGFSLIRGEPPA